MKFGIRARDAAPERVLAHSPVVLYLVPLEDERSRLSWVSDSVLDRLGYAPEDCLAPDWWQDHVHPDDRATVESQWPTLRWAERLVLEYRFRRADGSYRWLRDELNRADGDGPGLVCIGAWSDITDARQAAADVAQAEAQLRGIVEEAPHGVLVQQAGRVCYANAACLRLFGYDQLEQVVDEPWTRFVAPEEQPRLRERFAACLRGETVPRHPGWQGMHRDETRVWLDSTDVPFTWHGQPAVLSFLADVSQRRRLEAQFQQAQKMEALGRLAAGVAHDFNNVLTVINGYAELLLGRLAPSDPQRPYLTEMRDAGERAVALTRQLVLLGRAQTVQPRVLDPNAAIGQVHKLLRRVLGEDIDLDLALRATRRVLADPGQLDQVVLNLTVNARDAMPHGGQLTIETHDVDLDAAFARVRPDLAPGPYVLLAVSDTGCGMTPEVQARAFEPFFTTKEPSRGSGLGLATVYGIVKQAGGHVSVYSEPDRGTAFKIYLPSTENDHRNGQPAGLTVPVAYGTETVLIVEDEASVRALIREALENRGYRVLEAQDGAEALCVYAQAAGPVDLLITDVVMPRLSGQQLADALRALRPALRVLYVSGYTDEAIVRHGILREQVHFLQKPFEVSELAHTVRALLDA